MASSRLCSRLLFPSNNRGKSELFISLCNPRPPLRPLKAPRGELLALGVLTEAGDVWGFGIPSCHEGGVALQARAKL